MAKAFRKTSIARRTISIVTAAVLFTGSLPLQNISDGISGLGRYIAARAVNTNNPDKIFTSLSDFATNYSANYAANAADWAEDNIVLTLGGGETMMPDSFVSLGTSDHPFNGTITITQTGGSTYQVIKLDKPFFDYVTDSVQIVNGSTHDPIELRIERSVAPGESDSPLFAKHVSHADGGADWKVGSQAYSYDGNTSVFDFSGVIGELQANAQIKLNFNNSSVNGSYHSNVAFSDNGASAGLICGKMGSNSRIDLSLSGTNTGCTITSSTAHAGGLVGEMSNGSVLNIKEYSFTADTDRAITASTAGKCAGGLVGYSVGGKVTIDEDCSDSVTIKDCITAGSAAGGLIGSYKTSAVADGEDKETLDLTGFNINCKTSASYTGGVFGVLETADDFTVHGGSLTVKNLATNSIFGGIAGVYKTNSSEYTLYINSLTTNTSSSVATASYGGAVGDIQNGTTVSYAYVKADNFTHNSTSGSNNSTFGGVIGRSNNKGNFLDIGSVTIKTNTSYKGGGLVGELEKGVLRLSGTTNLTQAAASSGRFCGQLVGKRKDALVYALSSGNDENAQYDSGWSFNRSNTDASADDIGGWGEVVRISNPESNILTLDKDTHYVTLMPISAAPTISDDITATKLALNIQLNGGSDIDALRFDGTSANKTALLASTITFSGDISLSGTGITGLMRDDYVSSDSELGIFTGKIIGTDNAVIRLAIGERYGIYSGTSTGRGAIYAHRYNGLLARTGTGAEISGITISSTGELSEDENENTYRPVNCGWNINSNQNYTYVGGVAAQVTDGINITNVTCNERINYYGVSVAGSYIGGYIGEVTSANTKNITISDLTAQPEIVISGDIKTHKSNSAPVIQHAVGGIIGLISSTKTFETEISNVTIRPVIDASNATSVEDFGTAGLIADIVSNSSDNRTLTLTDVSADGVMIKNTATNHSGGILGHYWLNTNVTMNNVTLVKTGDIDNTIDTNAKYCGGLVYRATGHWTIPSGGLSIESFIDSRESATAFGMIVNDGYDGTYGLYLELTAADSYYLDNSSLTVPSPSDAYDELVAYVCSSANEWKNGNDSNVGMGIISIPAINNNDEFIFSMDEELCNSYQNVYNTDQTNSHSRYYYNLTTILEKENKTNGEKLLIWSLYHYASKNLSSYFHNPYPNNIITGTNSDNDFDMINISYYPIDINSATTIGNMNITFYNSEIETTESANDGNYDNNVRSTRSASQHYMMHYGLFKNVSSSISTTGNVHFIGNVGNDSQKSGILICGSLSGTLNTASDKEIVLEGITIASPNYYLLINSIGNNSTVKLYGVRTGGALDFNNEATTDTENYYELNKNKQTKIAKSLIGDVSGTGIQLEFGRIKLDGRKYNKNMPAKYSSLNTIYGTEYSIFSNATLLNKFDVDTSSTAVYNFEKSEDWTDSGSHLANVTYGKEIIDSKEFVNKQKKYYDQIGYTDPTTNSPTDAFTDFSNDFIPYVSSSTATGSTTREIKVNVQILGLTKGCGTYNHPYEITDGDQLATVAGVIAGTSTPKSFRLPKINNPTVTALDHWCNDLTECQEFELQSNGNYKYTSGSTNYNWTYDQLRQYLASAYYQIKKDITLDSSYTGLGSMTATDATGKYSFRGVIVGVKKDNGEYVTITSKASKYFITGTKNANISGLISMSNGSVIKDVNIIIDPDRTNYASKQKYDYASDTLKAYAYNDDFPNYGAVINKIMGGDNIIDNVTVTYKSNFKVLNSSDYRATVGGYVGCVVNGGLVFRNVNNSSLVNFGVDTVDSSGNVKTSSLTSGSDLAHLYVNPFVGRVINGYAIRETNAYNCSESGTYSDDNRARSGVTQTTLKNTQKNYSIPDIDATQNYQTEANKANVLTFEEKTEGSGLYNKIKVPNSQALYIMSIIAQSGAGCAGNDNPNTENNDYAYTISFDGGDSRNYSGNSKGNTYKASRHAVYNDIGTSASSAAGSDYDISTNDTINSKKAVPYIIYKYTSSYTSGGNTYYPARTLTSRSFYIELSGSNTYYLPDCFRGIGILNEPSNNLCMKLYSFNGNNNTIDINSLVYHKKNSDDPYFSDSGNKIGMNHGLALFNRITQIKPDNNRNYSSDTDHQINGFTLTGFIRADCRDSSGVALTSNGSSYNWWRTAGMVAFGDTEYYNVEGVTLNDLHIVSMDYSGGLFGRLDKSRVFINNCNATNLKVEGFCRIGGYIGNNDCSGEYDGVFINTANSSATSTLTDCHIIHLGTSGGDDKWHCAGIVMGQVYSGSNKLRTTDVDCAHCIIRSVTVNNSEVNSVNDRGRTGGILGGIEQNSGVLIIDCNINNLNVHGMLAGGIVGRTTNAAAGLRIVNCNVTSSIGAETQLPNAKIYGKEYAGGIIGHNETKQGSDPKCFGTSYSKSIDGCKVNNYEIESATGGSGGVLGELATDTFTIANTKVESCYIHSSNNNSVRGIGAVVGSCSASKAIKGYNVVTSNNTLTNTNNPTDALLGTLVGNANSKLTIKLVGYTRMNNKRDSSTLVQYDIGRTSGTDNIPSSCNSSSYIIYTDYAGKCLEDTPNKQPATFTDTSTFVSEGIRGEGEEYFPYTIVNPTTMLGASTFLTGDGAALNESNKPIAADIVDDNTYQGYIGCLRTTANGADTDVTAQTSAELKTAVKSAIESTNDSSNRISTYVTEMPTAPFKDDFDFPVVVINTQNKADSTSLIDSYIRLLTNSSNNYRLNNSGVYTVSNIYACTYDGNNYVIDTEAEPGLKYETNSGGRFYMEKGYADSNQDNSQISLIDVEFYDPNNSQKVAYHLYVPVLTKKMISFSFKSASLAGTDFKADTTDPDSPDPYEFGNKLAEELGAWFTSYMVFTYPKSELQELIDSGKGLNWNHRKVIDLNYNNTDGTLNGNTQLVLVDISSGDKAYYSKLSDVKSSTEQCDTIELSAFKDSSGGDFTQCTLNDFTSVTAEQVSSNGNYKITNDESKAVVKAMLNGEEKMFEYDAQNGTYKLTVEDDGYERYFLSFLTPGTGSICNFDIYCPKYLSGTGGAPKGIRNDNDSLKTVVITGNIFTQTTTETVALVGNTSSWVVDSIYNKLKVDVSTTISWADANQFGYLSSHLNDDHINIYHAFVLELSKHMQSSTTNIIGGNPTFTTTYRINGSPFKIGDDDEGEITTNHGGKQYALLETHDIKKYLTQSSSPVTVTSSTIIDYSDGTDRVNAFPTAAQNGNIGVNISATSSLSYSGTEEKLVYSTMKDTAYDNKYYYIKETENASLSYNAKLLDDIYDKDGLLSKNKSQLGLNARNLADEARTFIPLETVASYNASVIDISEADSLICTLSLYKKNDSGEYEKVNDLSDYFTDEITLTSTDTSIAQINATVDVPEADSVVFTSGDEALNLTAKTFDADISYSAKIKGDGFNEYANYKVLIEVKLLKADTEPVEGSTATNYIIYTNAKIDPSIVHS